MQLHCVRVVVVYLIGATFLYQQCLAKKLDREEYVQQYLPLTQAEVFKQYKEYAYKLLQDQPFAQDPSGLLALNPFAVGHALAVVNENVVLNVSSAGIEDVLKIGCYKITPAYKDLIKALSGKKIKITSTIYTKQEDVYLSPGLGKLKTFVNLVDADSNDFKSIVSYINGEIQKKLKNNVVPLPFFPTSLPSEKLVGDYLVNTFEYQSNWPKQWRQLAEPTSFYSLNKTVQVPFMEMVGTFDLFVKDNNVLVRIPLEAGKNLIMIKCNTHLVELLKVGKTPEDWANIMNKLWNKFVATAKDVVGSTDEEWAKTYMNIKVPVLKKLVGTSLHENLRQLGLKTLCPTSQATANSPTDFLTQFGQLASIDFNPEKVTFVSITGAKNIGQLRQENTGSRRKRSSEDIQADRDMGTTGDVSEGDDDDKTPPESKQIPVGEPIETFNIVFDQPFFWLLEDGKIGPIVGGGVLLPFSGQEKLSEEFMKQYLVCDN